MTVAILLRDLPAIGCVLAIAGLLWFVSWALGTGAKEEEEKKP